MENCRNYAAVNAMTSFVGGIVGYNHTNGRINKCYNAGAVSFGTANGGGIVGYNAAAARVSLCQNDGDVFNKSFDKVTAKPRLILSEVLSDITTVRLNVVLIMVAFEDLIRLAVLSVL